MKSKFIFIFGALGGLLFGYDLGSISGVLEFVKKDFNPSAGGVGIIVSSVSLAAIVSCFVAGWLADIFGRKQILFICAFMFFLGGLGCGIAPNAGVLILSRLIIGLAVGGVSVVVPVYLAEFAEKKKRGVLVALNQLMAVIGIMIAYFFAIIFYDSANNWRYTLGFALVPSLLLFIGTLFLKQSPRFLVLRGKVDEAKAILKTVRAGYSDSEIDAEIEEIKEVSKKPEGSYKDLLAKKFRKSIVGGVGAVTLTQFLGINAIIYYAPQILSQGKGFVGKDAVWLTVGIGFINLLGTFVGLYIVSKLPRKTMLIIGASICALGYAFFVLLNVLKVTSAIVFVIPAGLVVFGFATTWGCLVWVVASEMFPLHIRGKAVGIALGLNYFANFLIGQFFPTITEKFTNIQVYGGFFIIVILIIVFVKKFVFETSNLSLEEIENEITK